jgi:hypothetical protein
MGDEERTVTRSIVLLGHGGAKHDKQRTRDLPQRKRRPMVFMCREEDHVFVLHHATESSGGKLTPVELGDFLRKGNAGAEHQALRQMIGGLLDD